MVCSQGKLSQGGVGDPLPAAGGQLHALHCPSSTQVCPHRRCSSEPLPVMPRKVHHPLQWMGLHTHGTLEQSSCSQQCSLHAHPCLHLPRAVLVLWDSMSLLRSTKRAMVVLSCTIQARTAAKLWGVEQPLTPGGDAHLLPVPCVITACNIPG